MDYENDLRPTKVAVGTVPSFVFDPYNPKNKEITKDQVQTLLRQYGVDVPITNLQLYRRAFVHVSYVHKPQQNIVVADKPDDCLRLYSKSNERLEFLGDGILEAVVKFYMYRRFPRASEGFMTDKKIAVVKNESIGRIALALGLDQFYILSRYAESKQTRSKLEKLGCLFEAFVGALFLDFTHQPPCTSCGLAKRKRTTEGIKEEEQEQKEEQEDDVWDHTGPGFQVAQRFLENVLERHVDWVQLIARDDNFKNILQVILQKEFKVTPHYLELPAPNPNQYHMGVFLCLGQAIHQTSLKTSLRLSSFGSFQAMHDHMATHGKLFVFLGEGVHAKKKKAEQIACENALEVLYRHVLRSIVYKELGLPVDVVHDDATKTSQIVVMLNKNNNNNNNKRYDEKRKMTSSITFQQLRDVTESLCLVLGEGYHPNDVHRATHLAYEEAFFLLKQYE